MNFDSYIGGRWRPGDARIDVLDPSYERVAGSVARASIEDCAAAVDAAAEALPRWAATPSRERGEVLRGTFERMRARRDELAALISLENGKSRTDALGEVDYAAEFFRWYSEEAVRIGGELRRSPLGDKRIVTLRQPIGVALLITPWNFPAAMATRKIAPALAAGCTAVLKPATETPLTAFAVLELMVEAGLPPGVLNVVCPRPTGPAVAAMMEHDAVRTVSFTGSTSVGELLLEQAAKSILRCSMELGGNAPFIVFDDADLELSVEAAMIAKMRNGGASCIAANRFYVQQGIADAFTDRLAARMGEMAMGASDAPSTTQGPLVSAIERDRVARLVADAVATTAQARIGGTAPSGVGYFYPATVLDNVSADAPLLSEEIFGPVAPIVTFSDDADAIELANATDLGLAAYVCTSDLSKGMRTAEALEAGIVGLNRGFVSDPAAPFGGVKHSGLGREGGREGIEEFLETKYVAVDW